MNSWVITLPKTVRWEDYQKEIDAVRDGSLVMNYKTRYFPKEMSSGDRCYLVWDGKVRGWMEIVNMAELKDGFKCKTTGAHWEPGKYIQRSGPFNVVDGPDMQGFRGIRKYSS